MTLAYQSTITAGDRTSLSGQIKYCSQIKLKQTAGMASAQLSENQIQQR
ncbi:hypothetical protein RG47T_5196 [Mucilaginibacter polytrichastri]|uniref:Uncharacterized protein n=1 Tax=Mucilaginibacter polytrichastri TaxID=1302689 RepID=A0A1Q6A6S0_9SPHI|nr:hypothetical protein RG47T_5196 [Mucilaginibacter polytrichastri]